MVWLWDICNTVDFMPPFCCLLKWIDDVSILCLWCLCVGCLAIPNKYHRTVRMRMMQFSPSRCTPTCSKSGQPEQAEQKKLCAWVCLRCTKRKEKFGRESAKPPFWKTIHFRISWTQISCMSANIHSAFCRYAKEIILYIQREVCIKQKFVICRSI